MSKNGVFSEGTVDPRVRRFLRPKSVVWQEGTTSPESLVSGQGSCVLRAGQGKASVVVDFGLEIHGGIRIANGMTPEHKPARLHVRFGESVAEVMGTPNQDHAIHDMLVEVPWYGYQEFGNTGFRFVRIDLDSPDATAGIKSLEAVMIYRDLEYKGSFRCCDDRLNRIWDVGAYTVHLCMQDRLWDGIKRDRLVWIGDMHPETMTICSVFGGHEIVPASLDFVRDSTPLPGWMNGISSYSLWWVIIQHTWYMHHGNRDYLEQQRPYLCALLNLLLSNIGPDGCEHLGEGRFLDWPSSEDKNAIHAGLQALLRMGLKGGAELCNVLGESSLQQRCLDGATLLTKHTPANTPSKQANALLALSGLADAKTINNDVLAKDPLQGISTFYGYYVLRARAMAGDIDGAIEVIRKFWGAMIELGATTFWEDFNLDWTKDAVPLDQLVPEGRKSIHADYGNYCYKGLRHSLCHGWASGPTAWLSEHVLGFQPLAPGCRRLRIAPYLGDLDFAEGTFPTPQGIVTVKHTRGTDGSIHTERDVPAGIEVVGPTGS